MIFFAQLNNDYSGSTRILRNSVDVALSQGLDCRIYVSTSYDTGLLSPYAARITRYWYRKSANKALRYLFLIISQLHMCLLMWWHGRRYEHVTVYQNTVLAFGAALYARLSGARSICHIHETSLGGALYNQMLKAVCDFGCPVYVYVSHAHRDLLGWDTPQAHVVHNAVDPALFQAGARVQEKPTSPVNIYFPSAPLEKKGFSVFLNLARTLASRNDIRFHWVANCSDLERQTALAHFNVPTNVVVHEVLADMTPIYQDADVVLNLSDVNHWVETFGMTIVEAMAFGCVVIAPPVGGPAEIVTDGHDGILRHGRDMPDIVDILSDIADRPEHYRHMSQMARRRSADFTFDRFAAQILPILIDPNG
jgi:L-malate glycosyltransferase